MKRLTWPAFLLLAYLALAIPMGRHLLERPAVVQLGFWPSAEILRFAGGDQKQLLAELAVCKVLFYYGTMVEKWKQQIIIPPEFYTMYRTLETATRLDPYNADSYYFAQAAFTWEVGRAAEVNHLLEYGMRYRAEDWTLPFFVGFNSAYFLKDYEKGAKYLQRAAELSGQAYLANLSSRYFFEAGRSEMGIAFLRSMEAQTKDQRERDIYALRRTALEASFFIEQAVALYRDRYGKIPANLLDLVKDGLLAELPKDPYGGVFYLDSAGKVRTTSEFVFKSQESARGK